MDQMTRANRLPAIDGGDGGLRRRLVRVPFLQRLDRLPPSQLTS